MKDNERGGPVFVTWNDDALWLECFADHPARGQVITRIDSGAGWSVLAATVAAHQAAHGCGAGGAS